MVPPTPTYGITLAPSDKLTFPTAVEGYAQQSAKTITIRNSGTGDISSLHISLSGTNADNFTLNKTAITSLAPNNSDSFTVTPNTGLLAGNYTADVTVSGSNGVKSSPEVQFTVTAVQKPNPGGGKYSFVMPASNVTVTAVFQKIGSTQPAQGESITESKQTVIKMQIHSKNISVDGVVFEKDAAPVIRNNRTLVPIRFITESLGGQVAWNNATKEVTLTIDGKEIKMTIGKTLEKYGVAPVIIEKRTFVPIRFVADELGANTAWSDTAKTVTITKALAETK